MGGAGRSASALIAGGILLLAAAREATGRPPEAPTAGMEEAARLIQHCDEEAVRPLEAFERSAAGGDAARALVAARASRNRLEALRAPAVLARAREEELVFLNHAVGGLAAWLEDPTPGARDRLDSILRRGRAHRERSRRALASVAGTGRAGAPRPRGR
ncbi:MAG: hypothetical protein ABI592_13280 [Acidobacteriota bacterium]